MNRLITRRIALSLAMAAAAVFVQGTDLKAQTFRRGTIYRVSILPSGTPAFGQTIQMTVRVTSGGVPVSNAPVELWFSGRHGIQSGHWRGNTDKNGYCTTTRQIPREWKNGIYGDPTWVDLNVACNRVAALALFRVRNKP